MLCTSVRITRLSIRSPTILDFASRLSLLLLFVLFGQSLAHAGDVHELIRDLKAYPAPKATSVVRVPTARIVVADHDLVRNDFAQTRNLSDLEIQAWLLDQCGYVARSQVGADHYAKLRGINPDEPGIRAIQEPIPADYDDLRSHRIKAFRPEGYGRALVFDVGGLIDGKGFGGVNPQPGSRNNGLASTQEALREFVVEKYVRRILARELSGDVTTVRNYAVIDWGFKLVADTGELIPAGAVLRQGHARNQNTNRFWANNVDELAARRIELALRKYGLTSTGTNPTLSQQSERSDLVNIQGISDHRGKAKMVDFGGIVRVPNNYLYARKLTYRSFRGGNERGDPTRLSVRTSDLIDPSAPDFVKQVVHQDFVPETLSAPLGPGPIPKFLPDQDGFSKLARTWVAALDQPAGTAEVRAAIAQVSDMINDGALTITDCSRYLLLPQPR